MKFGTALERNTLEDWKEYYVNYAVLKKQLNLPIPQFLDLLHEERTKIVDFYNTIIEHIEFMATQPTWNHLFDFLTSPKIVKNKKSPLSIQISHFQVLPIDHEHTEQDLITFYQYLCHLQNYTNLNYSGLRKICKKFDKMNHSKISSSFMAQVNQDTWYCNNERLKLLKSAVVSKYAHLTNQPEDYCHKYLEKHMTDLIVYTKNTVWRDMQHPTTTTTKKWQDSYDYQFSYHKSAYSLLHFCIFLVLLIGIPQLSGIKAFTKNKEYQNNCFGVLFAIIYLWATETIPLFTTALLIPLLLVTRNVLINKEQIVLPASVAAKLIFTEMFYSPIIILLLGGFTLASALSKYRILQSPCDATIKHCNHSTYKVLFVIMNLATMISGVTSNVAAPVLCTSLIHSLLKQTPVDTRIGKSLILGIAMSSNIGGMITPIASPQNIITIHLMQAKWLEWMFVTIPVCLLCNIFIFVLIVLVVRPDRIIPLNIMNATIVPLDGINNDEETHDLTSAASETSANSFANSDPEQVPLINRISQDHAQSRRSFISGIISYYDPVQWVVVLSAVIILGLWVTTPFIKDIIGDVSIISLIPILFYFGLGFLNKDDFNDLLWSVVVLAQGGILLGKAIENTGLLHLIGQYLSQLTVEMTILQVLLTFSFFTLIAASMISHTVAALIVLPMIKEIGNVMAQHDVDHSKLLVMGVGLICSAAMALPISGFPNMHAINVEDPNTGIRYLNTKDFLKVGVPASLISMLIITTVGYGLMELLHF